METTYNTESIEYREAVQKVKRLKGFYIHLTIYILVNTFLIFDEWNDSSTGHILSSWSVWSTPIIWGIGLLAHAAGVFCPSFFLGKDWEDKKIKELTEKYK